jgi:hypothetical protein
VVRVARMLSEYELALLVSTVKFVDTQLAKLDRESRVVEHPDPSWLYDEGEYVIGLGFVSCQRFISVTCAASGTPKEKALEVGPLHRSKLPFVRIANAAGNHWKHSDDDDRGTRRAPQRKSNDEVFRQLGVDPEQPYVLSRTLAALLKPHPTCFKPLLPFLRQWRDIVLSDPERMEMH